MRTEAAGGERGAECAPQWPSGQENARLWLCTCARESVPARLWASSGQCQEACECTLGNTATLAPRGAQSGRRKECASAHRRKNAPVRRMTNALGRTGQVNESEALPPTYLTFRSLLLSFFSFVAHERIPGKSWLNPTHKRRSPGLHLRFTRRAIWSVSTSGNQARASPTTAFGTRFLLCCGRPCFTLTRTRSRQNRFVATLSMFQVFTSIVRKFMVMYCLLLLRWYVIVGSLISLRVPPATSTRSLQWICTAPLQNAPKTTRNERTCFGSPFRTELNTCFKRTISYEPNSSPHSLSIYIIWFYDFNNAIVILLLQELMDTWVSRINGAATKSVPTPASEASSR